MNFCRSHQSTTGGTATRKYLQKRDAKFTDCCMLQPNPECKMLHPSARHGMQTPICNTPARLLQSILSLLWTLYKPVKRLNYKEVQKHFLVRTATKKATAENAGLFYSHTPAALAVLRNVHQNTCSQQWHKVQVVLNFAEHFQTHSAVLMTELSSLLIMEKKNHPKFLPDHKVSESQF